MKKTILLSPSLLFLKQKIGQETVVYRVTHRRRGKELAAKIQVAPQSEDLSLSNRSHETLNEKCDSKEKYARLLNCPHPNLVRYRGFFDSPHFCVIMDYLAIGLKINIPRHNGKEKKKFHFQ